MSFEYKYCKYKNKYLKLKENQLGGALYDNIPKIIEETENKNILSEFLLPLLDIHYKTIKLLFEDEKTRKKIHIIKITLNQDKKKPVLFALAGISHKSFMGTSSVIIPKLQLLETKFKEVYLVEYADFSDEQDKACNKRDENMKKTENPNEIFKPEQDMNDNIAEFLNNIILNNLNLNKVHLLGKCNGAWVVTLLLTKNKIYKGLYLAVPGIAFNVEALKSLSVERLEQINFVFGWDNRDGFPFKWKMKSNEEKQRYDKTMDNISKANKIKLKYQSKMYNATTDEEDEKKYHEIFPNMIDDIVKSIK